VADLLSGYKAYDVAVHHPPGQDMTVAIDGVGKLALHTWALLLAAASCLLSFGFYAWARGDVQQAHEARLASVQLAAELRQSSDDLTRMARAFAVTREPVFMQHYEVILDIRDGKRPRPLDHAIRYWDVLAEGTDSPDAALPPRALLAAVREAGFSNAEITRLADAKAISDALVRTERAAMRQSSPAGSAGHRQAVDALFGIGYHRAKADVMAPVAEFGRMADRRTQAALDSAQRRQQVAQAVFVGSALLVAVLAWRMRASFDDVLGAPLPYLATSLDAASVAAAPPGTVLAILQEARSRIRALFEASEEAICVLQDGSIRFVNHRFEELIGRPSEAVIGLALREFIHEDDLPAAIHHYADRLAGRPAPARYAIRVRTGDGEVRWVELRPVVADWDGRKAVVAFLKEAAPPQDAEVPADGEAHAKPQA
jgi:PAS domain S-box-containing protein